MKECNRLYKGITKKCFPERCRSYKNNVKNNKPNVSDLAIHSMEHHQFDFGNTEDFSS